MKRIPKGVHDAIDKQQQLYWTGRHDSWLWELRAVTATNENGTERSRHLTTCDDDRDVLSLSEMIVWLGGKIDMQKVKDQVDRRREEWQKTVDDLFHKPIQPGVTESC